MTIHEIFEAYREAVEDAHYNEQDYWFDPESFGLEEEAQ